MKGPFADEVATAAVAAAAAADTIRRAASARDVSHKGAVDLVSEVDLAAEAVICKILAERCPGVPILAEEGGGASGQTTRWIVDPLDGTTNFVHGMPHYAVSVALQQDGDIVAGCIHDVPCDLSYRAGRGSGAWCDDKRLAVSDTPNLDAALLLTGFPYDRRERAARYLKFVLAMLERAQGLRRAGSACQDLCWIASGVGDGYWEFGLQTWDVAAGILLVEEAGGCVTDIAGGPLDLQRPRLLATNGRLHAEMHAVLAPLLSSADGLAGDSGA